MKNANELGGNPHNSNLSQTLDWNRIVLGGVRKGKPEAYHHASCYWPIITFKDTQTGTQEILIVSWPGGRVYRCPWESWITEWCHWPAICDLSGLIQEDWVPGQPGLPSKTLLEERSRENRKGRKRKPYITVRWRGHTSLIQAGPKYNNMNPYLKEEKKVWLRTEWGWWYCTLQRLTWGCHRLPKLQAGLWAKEYRNSHTETRRGQEHRPFPTNPWGGHSILVWAQAF